jgi:hypothetical protein
MRRKGPIKDEHSVFLFSKKKGKSFHLLRKKHVGGIPVDSGAWIFFLSPFEQKYHSMNLSANKIGQWALDKVFKIKKW